MKTLIISLVFTFTIFQIQAQCEITSVKEGPYRLEMHLEGGSYNFVQWNKKDVYDYSSCWMGVVQRLSGTTYVYLYNGSRNTPQKSLQFSSGHAKSIKIIGNKVKVIYDDGTDETKDIQ